MADTHCDVMIEDARWAAFGLESLAQRAVRAALAHLPPGPWEVSLLACNDTRIAALNADFRGKPVPTNILSWPGRDRGAQSPGATPAPPDLARDSELGDLAIAFDICMGEAAAAGILPEHHVTHLLVHGTLHLLGYDHETDADAERMEGLETAILARLDIADPYGPDAT